MALPPWAVTPEKVKAAIERIVKVARPKRIILFGSAARDPKIANDVDLLVVLPNDVPSFRAESVRIRRHLDDVHMAMDILVISESKLRDLADVPGLIYREALRTGKVLYAA